MHWRKWVVRSLVCSVAALVGASALVFYWYTDPAAVRRLVISHLGKHFPGAAIEIEGAGVRLLGGTEVTDLRIRPPGATAAGGELMHVPSAIFYHDKEQILDGKLCLRRIELVRPTIRLVRDADGRWNFDRLFGPDTHDGPLPMFVVKHGTVLIEDRRLFPGAAPVEFTNVDLRVINDPVSEAEFHLSAGSALLGRFQVSGTWNRVSHAVDLTAAAAAVPLGPCWLRILAGLRGEGYDVCRLIRHVGGKANVQAHVGYTPGSAEPWRHDVRVTVAQGRFEHGWLPVPVDHISLTARCLDGVLTVDQLTGTAGSGTVNLSLKSLEPGLWPGAGCPSQHFEDKVRSMEFRVTGFSVSAQTFDQIHPSLARLREQFEPVGVIDWNMTVKRFGRRWERDGTLTLRDLGMRYEKFRYPLEHVRGTLRQRVTGDGESRMDFDLVGLATGPDLKPSSAVTIKGLLDGDPRSPGIHIDIRGSDVMLTDALRDALPDGLQRLANSFHPRGQGNFVAVIHRDPGGCEFENRYAIRFHHAALRYDVFRYPLEDVSGDLVVNPDRTWEFTCFRGSYKGCEVFAEGRMSRDPAGEHLEVRLTGRSILLDLELKDALPPDLKPVWATFSPGGRLDFTALIDRRNEGSPELDVDVRLRDVTARPEFFRYDLTAVTGNVRYYRHWVYLSQLRARHGAVVLAVREGQVYPKPGGGFYARLFDVQADPLVPDQSFRKALPPVMRDACTALEVRDPLALRTDLWLDQPPGATGPPTIYWDGGVTVRNAHLQTGLAIDGISGTLSSRGSFDGRDVRQVMGTVLLDRASVLDQPMQNVQLHFEVPDRSPDELRRGRPVVMRFEGLEGTLFGGKLYGGSRLEFAPNLHYEVDLRASNLRLEEFVRHNLGPSAQINGIAEAKLFLHGDGTALDGLEGRGSLDVPNGRMYNLPVLLDLIKWLGLRPADRTAFEEASATFAIHGQRVAVGKLDLYGNAISLSGQGELNLDGTGLQLDFFAVPGRVVQMLPPLLSKIPEDVSSELFRVKMRGSFKKVELANEPVPILMEPMRKLLEKLTWRSRARTTEPATAAGAPAASPGTAGPNGEAGEGGKAAGPEPVTRPMGMFSPR